MAYTTINKSTSYFNTKLYTGNGSTQSITGVGFQPDWLWIKSRGSTGNHRAHDVVRGVDKQLYPNLTNAEYTYSPNTGVTSFDSDGFSLGNDAGQNTNNETYVAWNWLAGGSQGSSNTDGTINTTYTSANTTSGFSIVSYTGNGTSGATVGHGLGAVPHMIMVKRLDTTGSWQVYHQKAIDTSGDPWTDYMILNSSNAAQDGVNRWNDTAPTTSVFSLGNSTEVNANGGTYVAYVFSEKTGYSKFGSYTGNGNADGTFIYTGFKPSFYMVKQSNVGGEGWFMWDNKRSSSGGTNENDRYLIANSANADGTLGVDCDFLSNGVKTRYAASATNTSGSTYIYMAFGQSLVGSNNVPCTAR